MNPKQKNSIIKLLDEGDKDIKYYDSFKEILDTDENIINFGKTINENFSPNYLDKFIVYLVRTNQYKLAKNFIDKNIDFYDDISSTKGRIHGERLNIERQKKYINELDTEKHEPEFALQQKTEYERSITESEGMISKLEEKLNNIYDQKNMNGGAIEQFNETYNNLINKLSNF